MKKQILIYAIIGFLTINFIPLMAQEGPGRKPPREQAESLTDKQVKKVNKILADYKGKSLSAEDAKSIMAAFREAEIPGGKGLESAVSDAGFSLEEIRKLAPAPPRPEGKPRKR